ncbi:potassium channel family protein [Paenibacillus puldeungensis]|uniref:Trk system potassium uptake protein TrkA n=1 Tax=Paenibacillus puldeungensis TaxID=696536 RepID=A0ABW3RS36_9BACL
MKIIVVGCGRMGTGLSLNLAKKGHHITVIDSNPEAFETLGVHFTGDKIAGNGFDREVLTEAKIDQVDAVVCCTKSDEANAVIARVARNVYHVPCVIARLYDPLKADIYQRLGIQTISTTSWGIEKAAEIITYNQFDSVFRIGNGDVDLLRIEVPSGLVGHTVDDVTALGEIQVVSISRANRTFIPTLGTILEEGDILYISTIASATKKLKSMLALA